MARLPLSGVASSVRTPRTCLPIALGERLYNRWDFKPFFEAAALDIIQPDLSHAGGLSECRRIVLESVPIEHSAVLEAAVVPSPDPLRLSVPKAYVTLATGHVPDANTALSILRHVRARVSPYKRIRRIEFGLLPKTISGKIRRVDLRKDEQQRTANSARRSQEFWEEDLATPPA